ncbi:MAG: 5-methylthioadenosine/adenosylhomocysteine nucleosidase [Flavipsychrobacter sp.]|jgi:adenosylhomocysteine nucleosidase|nr:5-methylthioadenosine/adenosylhomocysteine nucleosidase [Flavipsychrobacter sp.]
MSTYIIGIMGAMPEEITGVVNLLTDKQEYTIGMRTFYTGKLNNINTVVVFSRWGKVAAAATVSTLILEFKITHLIFTGVAGAISTQLNIGDIVVANRCIQHDMDARPIMERYEIPLLGKTWFDCDAQLHTIALNAVSDMLANNRLHEIITTDELQRFGIETPKVLSGDVASGDKFFANDAGKHHLAEKLPSILCVEMEGAAVAQVCYEYNVPFIIIRTISDAADDHSAIDFPSFINSISGRYSVQVIRNIFKHIN